MDTSTSARKTLNRGKLGARLGSVATQQVKIDVRAWGFQLRGKLDKPGVAEARRTTLSIIEPYEMQECLDRKSTRLNSSHLARSRMPSSA